MRKLQKEQKESLRQRSYKEIQDVHKRRETREREQAADEELKRAIAIAAEQENNAGWREKEEGYHRKTAFQRSEKRVINHRPKPVDIITCVLHSIILKQKLVVRRIRSPVEVIENLNLEQLNSLLDSAEEMVSLMTEDEDGWHHVNVVAGHQLEILRGERAVKKSMKNIYNNIETELKGKSPAELAEVEQECSKLLDDNNNTDEIVDVEYWSELRNLCSVFKSRLQLKKYYTKYLDLVQESTRKLKKKGLYVDEDADMDAARKLRTMEIEEVDDSHIPFLDDSFPKYAELLPLSITPDDDRKKVNKIRNKVLHKMARKVLTEIAIANPMKFEHQLLSAQEKIAQKEASAFIDDGVNEIDIQMKNDVPIPVGQQKVYEWHNKYRPRKPQYFNRVKTGFSWTKYNQAHYNIENPPPKVVMGYKFNIFYPDIIDKSKPP
eukprot:UN32053